MLLLLCLVLAACGGAGKQVSDLHSGTDAAATGVAKGDQGAFGDYDHDDYVRGSSDADNDDSDLPKDRDGDSDNTTGSYYDGDDDPVRYYGHAASPADARIVTALLERYYAAAAAENGSAGCAMIASPLAKSVAETLGQAKGQPDLRGDSCPAVMTKVYKLNHRQLSAYDATLEVTGVRVQHDSGVAVLGFKDLPGREIDITRESGTWKVQALVDSELP